MSSKDGSLKVGPVFRARSRLVGFSAASMTALILAGCGSVQSYAPRGFSPSEYGVSASQRVVAMGEPVPKGGGVYRLGKPYQVRGIWYEPKDQPGLTQTGIASWYGDDFHGRRTANGEIYNMYALSAAHTTMPLPSYARVTNPANGRSLVVRVNDRGPYHSNRVMDLSKRAAMLLNVHSAGLARVKLEYIGRAPLHGNDDRWLSAQVKDDGAPMGAQMVAQLAPVPAWAAQDASQPSAVSVALADPVTSQPQLRGGYEVASLEPVPPPQQTSTQQPYNAYAEPEPQDDAAPAPLSLVPGPGLAVPASLQGEAMPTSSLPGLQVVQVGSFRDAGQAVRYRDALKKFGASSIDMAKINGVTMYQVKTGPFKDSALAKAALREAQQQGATNAKLTAL